MRYLSRKEELLLLTIWKLADNAYGVTIRDEVMKVSRQHWSIGAIYDVLDRLKEKGYVKRFMGDSMKERGGRRKRLYSITKQGYNALQEVKEINSVMWSELPEPKFD